MADKYKIERLISMIRGNASSFSFKCPVFEFLDGIIGNELVQVGEDDFIPDFGIIRYPLTDNDKEEIELIKNGSQGILL